MTKMIQTETESNETLKIIELEHADMSLVEIRGQHAYCKKHGAMNTVAKWADGALVYRCIHTYISDGKPRAKPTDPVGINYNPCRAGCVVKVMTQTEINETKAHTDIMRMLLRQSEKYGNCMVNEGTLRTRIGRLLNISPVAAGHILAKIMDILLSLGVVEPWIDGQKRNRVYRLVPEQLRKISTDTLRQDEEPTS